MSPCLIVSTAPSSRAASALAQYSAYGIARSLINKANNPPSGDFILASANAAHLLISLQSLPSLRLTARHLPPATSSPSDAYAATACSNLSRALLRATQ